MRQKLPNRRLSITQLVADEYYVSFGLDPERGVFGEMFIKGSKIGSDMEILLDDASVVLSLALQHGVSIEQLVHSLDTGREEGAKSIIAKATSLMGEEMKNVKKKVAGGVSSGRSAVPPTESAPEKGQEGI